MRANFPFLTEAMVGRLNGLYPYDPPCFPGAGCWWRQAANVYGETRYLCASLFVAGAMQRAGGRSWAYWWDVQDPAQEASGLGVPHTVETAALSGDGAGAPASYQPGGTNAAAVLAIRAHWASFITTLDPNTDRAPGTAEWTPYDAAGGMARLHFATGGKTSMVDLEPGLKGRCEYLWSMGLANQQ
ncbi:hypothetical protein P8C59_007509 [Phyllachora maydis]|nr:hypothetical protein P8C59_007509 [Phyllachora maydis]